MTVDFILIADWGAGGAIRAGRGATISPRAGAVAGPRCCGQRSSAGRSSARALPQALIAGKPVVSYDVDGARERFRLLRQDVFGADTWFDFTNEDRR